MTARGMCDSLRRWLAVALLAIACLTAGACGGGGDGGPAAAPTVVVALDFIPNAVHAPPYPEVFLITARKTLRRHRDRLVRALAAIEDGRRDVLAHPGAAARQIAQAAETRDVGLIGAQLQAVRSTFAPGLRLDPEILRRWADFDARIGIVDRRPDVERGFDLTLAPRVP
jgi:ABC-type nitrate/sulfonate/bicarbonate transport system substrate-binding protein